MNFPEHHRGKHTLSSAKKYKYPMPGFEGKGDITNTAYIK